MCISVWLRVVLWKQSAVVSPSIYDLTEYEAKCFSDNHYPFVVFTHTHTTNSHDTRKLFLFGYWIICLIFICATEMASEWGLFWFCTKVDKRRLQVSVRWDVEIGLSQSVCSNEVDRIQDRVHNRPELKWHFKRRLAENTNKLIDVGPNLVEIRWRQRENRRKFGALHINKIKSCRNTEIHQRHTYKRLWAIWVWMNNARKSLRICSWRTAAPRTQTTRIYVLAHRRLWWYHPSSSFE